MLKQITDGVGKKIALLEQGPNLRGSSKFAAEGDSDPNRGSAFSVVQNIGQWEQATDPATGHVYFFNRGTGESAWELPQGAAVV